MNLKILSLLIISILLFVLPVFAQENCQIAYPLFGIVECVSDFAKDGHSKEEYKQFTIIEDSEDIINFQCSGRCQIEQKSDIKINCDFPLQPIWQVYKNSNQISDNGWFDNSEYPLHFYDGDSITVKAKCGTLWNVKTSSDVKFLLWEKYLWETLPQQGQSKNTGTPGCIPQDLINKYYEKSLSSGTTPLSWITNSKGTNKKTLSVETQGKEFVENIQNLPTNMKVTDTYSFFYRWETVPDINIVYDKEGDIAGYCANKKLFNYGEIKTLSGSCYLIPTSIKKAVECCFDSDCILGMACNPITYTCSENKPCDSDLECPQGICSNNLETDWSCDKSKQWYPKSGTCVKSIKQVLCCSDRDCPADKYCNREEGCKDKYVLIDCPYGKCCKSGGDYKQKRCSSGMECCMSNDPFLGECKVSCVEYTTNPYNPPITPPPESVPEESYNPLWIILLLVISGVVVIGYFLWQKKEECIISKPINLKHKKVTSNHKNRKISNIKISTKPCEKFCTNCGKPLKPNAKFCINCGKKIRE
ncbi:MAG: zinc ribbon domain-containing protein [Candidatus Aenigmarchaeota archaeon]|nr:zinc ribbon domain-containing protein [Candidatus Aenigmarchaeota archaeon]